MQNQKTDATLTSPDWNFDVVGGAATGIVIGSNTELLARTLANLHFSNTNMHEILLGKLLEKVPLPERFCCTL